MMHGQTKKRRTFLFTPSRPLRACDQKEVTQLKPDSARESLGKAIKCSFAFRAAGVAGEKGTSDSILYLKYSFRQ